MNSPNMGDVIQFNHLADGQRTLTYYKLKMTNEKRFLLPKKLSDNMVFDNESLKGKKSKIDFMEGAWANIEITDLVHKVGGFYHGFGSSSRLYRDP